MTDFVLDNSVSMRWCFEDRDSPYADNVLKKLGEGGGAIVPILWFYEVASVMAKARRAGAITEARAADFVEALRFLNIAADDQGGGRVFDDVYRLATAFRVTGYDAVYLELALRSKLPLATLDAGLARACAAAGGVVL